MELRNINLTLCFLLICNSSFCQFDYLKKSISLSNNLNIEFPREKIFIHYDKPYYNAGDTIWLKGYIMSAKDDAATDSSKIAYIEIFKSTGKLIKRISTYAAAGIFYSNVKLNDVDFEQGTYLLRAYTNYMRNYGDSLFYESRFKIVPKVDSELNLLVHTLNILNGRFVFDAAIQPGIREKIQQQSLTVILQAKNKIVFKQSIIPDKNGLILIDTILSERTKDDILHLAVSGNNNLLLQLPVQIDDGMKTDLQFLPEGGTFIANKLQQLGFKAINILGNGIPVRGKIEDSQRKLITTFSSVHDGMGTVWLTPRNNERYTAVLDNGLTFPLPIPDPTGTQLQITNQPESDSVIVTIDASPDLYSKDYYFNATAKGISCAMGIIHLKNRPYQFSISKKAFPSGICRFTLYNGSNLPVNERIALIWHHDTLKLRLIPQKPFYDKRDSVYISISVKNLLNEPSIGSFSIAVIDTGQIQYPRYRENIISYMLLSSDLKGQVENPYYYFDNPSAQAIEALMLTQGWVRYNYFISKPTFKYEKEFMLKGKVTNLFNKPVANSDIALFGKDGISKPFILNNKTDNEGKFLINDFPVFTTDSVSTVIRALNKKGKAFGIGVSIDEPSFPEHHFMNLPAIQNEIFYDTLLTGLIQQQTKTYNQLKKEKNYLQEVIVTSKIKIRGSKNLNADGGADQVISEKILGKTPKVSLLEVLTKELAGFHKGPLGKSLLQVYKRNGDFIIFIIDGYNINQAYDPVSESSNAFTEYEEAYLKYITAEEVAGVEIMKTMKNTFAYEKYYNLTSSGLVSYTFIEITTRSGNGAFNVKVPGLYLYKPLVPVISKNFYSPRYPSIGNISDIPDYRSTLYWKPDIITDEKGEVGISFYTSDSSSGYLVIVQGTDLNGGLGVAYLPLEIKKDKPVK